MKEADVKPAVGNDAGVTPGFGLERRDAHAVPPPPPPDFFHPSVGDHPSQPVPSDPAFVAQHPPHAGQTFGPYPEGYVDPQAAWQPGAYPPQVDPATLQMVQHQYQAMGYLPDQALALATQYLTAATPAQQPDVHPAPAMHDPNTTFPVDPAAQQMYVGGDPAYHQGHLPPGHPPPHQPGYVHGHPPAAADYPHQPAQAPYVPETYPLGYVQPPEAPIPYESFAEMEAHLRAEMHPDPREAALFGDLPSARRPKGTKRQREVAALRKDLTQREEPTAAMAQESSVAESGKLPEPCFEASLKSEPDFDFETSSLAEPEEGQSTATRSTPKPKPPKEEPSLQKEGEDVVSSTNSAEMADLMAKEEQPSSSEFRPLKVKSRWRRNSEAEATSSTPPPPLSKRLLREAQERALQEAENADQGEEAQRKEEPAVPPPPPRKRLRLEAEAEQQEEEKLEAGSDFPEFEVISENIHLTERYGTSHLVSCSAWGIQFHLLSLLLLCSHEVICIKCIRFCLLPLLLLC